MDADKNQKQLSSSGPFIMRPGYFYNIVRPLRRFFGWCSPALFWVCQQASVPSSRPSGLPLWRCILLRPNRDWCHIAQVPDCVIQPVCRLFFQNGFSCICSCWDEPRKHGRVWLQDNALWVSQLSGTVQGVWHQERGAFFNISFSISMRCSFFLSSRISICSGVLGEDFGGALTLITQLFDPSCHCGKADIHSFRGICLRVVLVNNQLSGFAFKLCAEISFFTGAPVLFRGEHITSVQEAKLSVPLHKWSIYKESKVFVRPELKSTSVYTPVNAPDGPLTRRYPARGQTHFHSWQAIYLGRKK